MKNSSIFTLTHPKGSERTYRSKDGSKGSHICIGDVGYIGGTAWGVMALMLDGYTDSEHWQVVNIVDNQNTFLASIAVLGATGEEHAVNMALRTFNGDLGNIGQANGYDAVTVPAFVFKRLLDSESRAAFKSRITQNEISSLHRKLTSVPAQWEDTKVVSHGTTGDLMLDMVRYDDERELQQPITSDQAFAPLLEGSEMGQYDAIVTQVSRLDALSNRILVAMNKAADKVKPVKVEKTDPFKKHGVVNIAQYFEFDDGQSVTIVYHNPDSTPTRLDAKDLLTSWKFQLNKRDVTAALQPKSGKDVNIPQMAKRIMLLIEANSARFVRAQERKIKADKALEELSAIEHEKREIIVKLDQEITELQAELDKPIGEYVAQEDHGTITGKAEEANLVHGDKTYLRDDQGNIVNTQGKPFKGRVVAQGVITKLELKGHTVKVVPGGYAITELSDPTYKTNGYVTVGNAIYGDRIVKAEPKLLFEYHGHEFLVVKSDVGVESNSIEVIETKGRASIPVKDAKGNDQFFFNSVSTAYTNVLEALAGMSAEEFSATAVSKRKEVDLVTNNMIAEGAKPQAEDVLKEKGRLNTENKKAEVNAQLDALRDEKGKLNPFSDNPMERVRALEEMTYQERMDIEEAIVRSRYSKNGQEVDEAALQDQVSKSKASIRSIFASKHDDPGYLQANQDLYAELKKDYEQNLDNQDTNLVTSLRDKMDRQKSLLQSKGVSVEEPEDKQAPEVTRYDIQNPNPRRRKAVGLVKLTKRADDLIDVMLQQGTTGGEYVGDIDGVKRWLSVRMQSMGDALGDKANTWEGVAAQLKLTIGQDILGVDQFKEVDLKVEAAKNSELPEGVTQADLTRRESLKRITDSLRSIAEESNPRNLTIGGKSYSSHVPAMLDMADMIAKNPPQFTTASDVADILQYELNRDSKLRQYCVSMPRLDNVTQGNITNKLRRIDKAFKEANAPIKLIKSTGDSLLLSGDKPFSRIQFNYDRSYGDKAYFVSQTDRMHGEVYGKLIDAILDYLNEDKSVERKLVYFGRNGKVIDTATNQLGAELKGQFDALQALSDAGAAEYRVERAERMEKTSAEKQKATDLLDQYTDEDLLAIKTMMGGQSPEEIRKGFNDKINGLPAQLQKAINQLTGLRKLIDDQKGEMTLKEIREKGQQALKNIKPFLGRMQHDTIQGFIKRGEESQFYAEKMIELEQLIKDMPVTYQTDGQGKKAVAQLHYFRGNRDWYITEKDVEGGVLQAYGYVDAGHGLEGGYINIEEVASVNAELDLYFEPKTIHTVEGTEPLDTEDTTVMENNEDAVMLDKILSGEISPENVDMKDLEALAIKYGSDTDSEIYTKLEKAVGVAINAKIEKAKAVK